MNLQEIRLFVGLPCYGGQLYYGTAQSLIRLADVCRQLQVEMSVYFLGNESLVQRGRNRIVSHFMASEATHLLFIDSDISFDPLDVIRMLQSDFDFTVGAYPKKEIVWKMVHDAVRQGVQPDNLAPFAAAHVINFPDDVKTGKRPLSMATIGDDAIFCEALDGATGFMLLKRQVLDKMIAGYPETKYAADSDENYGSPPYALFDCAIEPESRRYLSEDYLFCRRWQRLGGKVWCCLSAKLDHTGTFTFRGDAARVLHLNRHHDAPVEFIDPLEEDAAAQ